MGGFVRMFTSLLDFGGDDEPAPVPKAPDPIPPPVAPELPKEVDEAAEKATKDQEEIAKAATDESIRARRRAQIKRASLFNIDEAAPGDILDNKGAF